MNKKIQNACCSNYILDGILLKKNQLEINHLYAQLRFPLLKHNPRLLV